MDRTVARAAAMKLVYEWEMGGNGGEDTIIGLVEVPCEDKERGYIEGIVAGVKERRAEIDALIEQYAVGWKLDRISRVDLSILRVAVYELLQKDEPEAVVLNEAVELAKIYSTERAGSFVNGVLGSISRARG